MDIESTTSIARPAAAVFAFVSDVRNDPQWHTDILEAKLTADGPIGVGSVFEIKFKPFMGQSRGTTTVARYEPPHHVVFETQMGKMAPTVSLTVESEGDGSRFTRRVEMKPTVLLRIMGPFMGGWMRKHSDGFLVNLKRVLESRS